MRIPPDDPEIEHLLDRIVARTNKQLRARGIAVLTRDGEQIGVLWRSPFTNELRSWWAP